MGLIRVRDVPIEVRIGALPEERISPQTVRLDLEVRAETLPAARADQLEEAVNYIDLVGGVRTTLDGASFHLVETLAARALDALLRVPGVSWARVRVRKYHLPGMGEVDHVEIEEERGA